MYRNKLLIEDVGLRLGETGRLEFCKYDDGFAASNLLIEFDAEYDGRGEDGRDEFKMHIISSAWFLSTNNAQHFNADDPLHVAASVYALMHEQERMLELAAASHSDHLSNLSDYRMAA
jgi:hypothetical protein